jgi:DNA-binding MarR family transcriptional regulator
VLAAQREGNRRLASMLRPLNLTPSQAEVARVLEEHAPISLGELGGLLVCETGVSPSRLVDRMVATGLVQRAPSPQDRRQVLLSLTAEGEAAAAAVREIEEEFYAGIQHAGSDADAAAVFRFLEAVTQGSPAGEALQRRMAAGEDAASPIPR